MAYLVITLWEKHFIGKVSFFAAEVTSENLFLILLADFILSKALKGIFYHLMVMREDL